jgi:hypothetical protein
MRLICRNPEELTTETQRHREARRGVFSDSISAFSVLLCGSVESFGLMKVSNVT